MLLEKTSKYRVDTEIEAKEMIEKFRAAAQSEGYVVKKAGYERKDKKAKGEIIATVFVVSATLVYNGLWEDFE